MNRRETFAHHVQSLEPGLLALVIGLLLPAGRLTPGTLLVSPVRVFGSYRPQSHAGSLAAITDSTKARPSMCASGLPDYGKRIVR